MTMTTTKQILNVLQIRYFVYDSFREACFQKWARKANIDHAINLRALVVHDGLRNWYCDQWLQLVEKQFIKENQIYFDLDAVEVIQDLFFDYPKQIEKYYPKTLLKMIKDEITPQRHQPMQQA